MRELVRSNKVALHAEPAAFASSQPSQTVGRAASRLLCSKQRIIQSIFNLSAPNFSSSLSYWHMSLACVVRVEGSMDPYSRAPRSPKSKQQSSKVFFDTGLTGGPQVEDCKSPSVEQVEISILSPPFQHAFNLPFNAVYFYVGLY